MPESEHAAHAQQPGAAAVPAADLPQAAADEDRAGCRRHADTEHKEDPAGVVDAEGHKEVRKANEELVAQRRAAGEKSSQYTGVTWNKTKRLWIARLHHGTKHIAIGSFDDETAAARAYDAEARCERGSRAHGWQNGSYRCLLNFPTAEEQRIVEEKHGPPRDPDEVEAIRKANEELVARRKAAGEN